MPEEAPPTSRSTLLSRLPAALVPVALVACAAIFCWQALELDRRLHFGFIIDDAYISLRHAQNLVDGHGLNFNPGERVEGYTNFLWTLLMSLPLALGKPAEPFVKVVGVLSVVVMMFAVFFIARRLAGQAAALCLVLALALDSRLAVLSTWGLEITFYPALCLLALWACLRNRALLGGLLFGLACMTRIEGVLLAGLAGSYLLVVGRPRRWPVARQQYRAWLASPLRFAASFLATFGTYFLLRWSYYGYLLPNTFYAKVGSPVNGWQRGLTYLVEMFGRMGLSYLMLLAAAGAVPAIYVLWRQRRQTRSPEERASSLERTFLIAAALMQTAYILAVGGDHFGERFIYHALPVFLIGAVLSVSVAAEGLVTAFGGRALCDGCAARWRAWAPRVTGLVAAGSVVAALWSHPHRFPSHEGIAGWASLGRYLQQNAEPGAVLATDAAGALPYFSRLATIDLLGLSDLHIAHKEVPNLGEGMAGHEKLDPASVLRRKPDFISSWVDASGRLGRGFAHEFEYRRWYALMGLVDLSRKDLDPARVRTFSTSLAQEEVARIIQSYPAPAWGIARRLERPKSEVRLVHADLASRLFDELPVLPGALLRAPRGHEPCHIVFGPYFRFGPGSYEWRMSLELRGAPEGQERLCTFESVAGVGADEAVLERKQLGSKQAGTGPIELRSGLSVGMADRERPYSVRLWCDGQADVTIRTVTVATADR